MEKKTDGEWKKTQKRADVSHVHAPSDIIPLQNFQRYVFK